MSNPNIAEIVKGLSEEELECFDWVRPCSSIATFRAGAKGIFSKGLVSKDALGWFHVTPLGLQVRKYIQENSDVTG